MAEAKVAGEESLAQYRELGDTWQIGAGVHNLGYIAAESGDWGTARKLFEEGVVLFQQAGDADYALWCTRSLGWTYHDTGDFARAREIHETNLRRAREIGNTGVEATTLGVLGGILLDEGKAHEAFPYIEQAYRMHAESGATLDVAIDLWRFAKALGGVGRAEEAAQLASLSDALREELGSRVLWVEREADKTIAYVKAQLDPDVFREAWERGKRLSIERAVEMVFGRAPAQGTVQSTSTS